MKLEPVKMPVIKTKFSLEALYYYSASYHLNEAKKSLPALQKQLKHYAKLEEEEKLFKMKEDHDKLESIAIQIIDHLNPLIESLYKPLLEGVALTHILCVASLEAHINVLAKDSLSGKVLDTFDNLSVESKWLYFPLLLGLQTFNPGLQPFQDFSSLIKTRNALMHYKPKFEVFTGEPVPKYLIKLGLTITDAEISLNVVPKMVSNLANLIKKPIPDWVNDEPFSYFFTLFE